MVFDRFVEATSCVIFRFSEVWPPQLPTLTLHLSYTYPTLIYTYTTLTLHLSTLVLHLYYTCATLMLHR